MKIPIFPSLIAIIIALEQPIKLKLGRYFLYTQIERYIKFLEDPFTCSMEIL